jgi:hypothetical protein
MNEDVNMKDGADLDDGSGLDAQGAAAIMQEAGERARRELRVSRPVTFVAAGMAWLLGYGAIWFSVRGQHPYQGPAPEAAVIQVVLIGFAVAIAASVIGRATSGVGGLSAVQRRVSILALATGIGLGLWLIAVASGGAFAGPVGVWAVTSLAGGLGYLLMAAFGAALDRQK